MKTAGIITIHKVYNYGAVLQSIALQNKIQFFGIDTEIVDFDSPQMINERKLFIKCNSLNSFLKNIRAIIFYYQLKKRKNAFDDFISEYMVISDRRYLGLKDFEKFPLNYDYSITGSDQTFCLHLRQNIDEMKPYFLEYAKGKRISYASSFGEKVKLNVKKEEMWIAERLAQYDCLSVRESSSVDYVKMLIGKQIESVLDPTLLFTAKDWEEYEKPTKYGKKEYILFYSVLSSKWVVDSVKKLSKQTKLKVIAVHQQNSFEFNCGFKRCIDIGPGEFLSLIKNAKYIVTTSFHATAFSLIYNKNFSSFLLSEGNRLKSLLELLGMEDRLVKKGEKFLYNQFKKQIDYKPIQEKLELERKKSLNFLNNAIL